MRFLRLSRLSGDAGEIPQGGVVFLVLQRKAIFDIFLRRMPVMETSYRSEKMSQTTFAAEVIAKRFQFFSSQDGNAGESFRVIGRYTKELERFIDDLAKAGESVPNCRISY